MYVIYIYYNNPVMMTKLPAVVDCVCGFAFSSTGFGDLFPAKHSLNGAKHIKGCVPGRGLPDPARTNTT